MSDKLRLLRQLDRSIYRPWLNQINIHYIEAVKLNKNKEFSYLFFAPGEDNYGAMKPNAAAKEYLDSLIPELAPIINERATINAYLLKYTNNVPNYYYHTVLHLVPEAVQKFYGAPAGEIPEAMQDVIQIYQRMPEYTLIKKRVFLGSMYGH